MASVFNLAFPAKCYRELKNFKHVLINNAVHDSVGGQPTGANSAKLAITRTTLSCCVRICPNRFSGHCQSMWLPRGLVGESWTILVGKFLSVSLTVLRCFGGYESSQCWWSPSVFEEAQGRQTEGIKDDTTLHASPKRAPCQWSFERAQSPIATRHVCTHEHTHSLIAAIIAHRIGTSMNVCMCLCVCHPLFPRGFTTHSGGQ